MTFSPRQLWWLNFLLFAIQGGTSVTWTVFGLDPKFIAIMAQSTGYASVLLQFVIHGSVPGAGMTERDPRKVPGTPENMIVESTKKLLIILAPIIIMLTATPAFAQQRIPLGPIGQRVEQAVTGGNAVHSLAQFFANWTAEDLKAASDLATAIPGLEDPIAKACWDTFASVGAVVKAHPLPATLKIATDIQAARLFLRAVKEVCQKPECAQVWNDLQNQVAALAPIPAPVALGTVCAKIP